MNTIPEFITNSLFILCYLFIAFSLANKKWKDLTSFSLCSIFISFILSTALAILTSPFHYAISGIIISLILIKLCINQSLSETMVYHVISYSMIGIFQVFPLLLMPRVSNSITSAKIQTIGQLVILLLCVLIYFKLPLWKLYQYNHLAIKIIKYVLICIYILILSMSIYSKYNAADSLLELPLIAFFILCLIYCLYQIYMQQQHNLQLSTQLEDYKTYQPVFEELVEHVRTRQHEFDNKLMAIRALPLTYKDYDSLVFALTNNVADVMDSLQNSSLLKLNMKVLSAFLFTKVQQANKKNIHIGIIIKNSYIQTIVPEHELLEIVGILIDNAIEAVESEDSITVSLDSYENTFEITTLNKGPHITPELRTCFFQKGYTTKMPSAEKPQRGTGLYRLKQLVEQYNGEILLNTEDGNGKNLVFFQVNV